MKKAVRILILVIPFILITFFIPHDIYNLFEKLGINKSRYTVLDSDLIYNLPDDFALELNNHLPQAALKKEYRNYGLIIDNPFCSFYSVNCLWHNIKYEAGYKRWSGEIIVLKTLDENFSLSDKVKMGMPLSDINQNDFEITPSNLPRENIYICKNISENWNCIFSPKDNENRISSFYKSSIPEKILFKSENQKTVKTVWATVMMIPYRLFIISIFSMIFLVLFEFKKSKNTVLRISEIVFFLIYSAYILSGFLYILCDFLLYGTL